MDILGINAVGEESGNDTIGEEADLPWLQDVSDQDVWGQWNAEWRDVVVLDADNVEVGRMNLTDHDLALPDNQQALRDLITQAGGP